MKSKEEILDSHYKENTKHIRSISPEQFPVAYRKTALDSMEEYATQFKDSPYQGSAGTWVKASERLPDTFWVGPVRFDHRKAHWTYGVRSGDQMVYAANLYEDLEWLDSAVSPAGDGWVSVEEQMPEHNIGVLVFIPDEDDHITSGMWDIEDKWVLLDDYRVPECEVTHWRPLPTPPKTSV